MVSTNEIEGTLKVLRDISIRRELDAVERSEKFNQGLSEGSNFRSGLETMQFLFDVINDLAGYTQKYYEETLEKIDHEGLI